MSEDKKKNRIIMPNSEDMSAFGKKSEFGSGNSYEDMNKLPLIMWEYRTAMMRTLKDKFMEQLNEARKLEKAYCDANGVKMMMNGKKYNMVCELLDRCGSLFDVEALARCVFDDNEIPTFPELRRRSGMIELVFPIQVKQ